MRNYEKESQWEKNKYERMQCKIDKELGIKFKEYLKENGISFADWLRKKIKEELKL